MKFITCGGFFFVLSTAAYKYSLFPPAWGVSLSAASVFLSSPKSVGCDERSLQSTQDLRFTGNPVPSSGRSDDFLRVLAPELAPPFLSLWRLRIQRIRNLFLLLFYRTKQVAAVFLSHHLPTLCFSCFFLNIWTFLAYWPWPTISLV